MISSKESLPRGCKKMETDLVLYTYGKCTEADRYRIQAHLQDCVACRIFLEDLQAHSSHVEKDDLPSSFWGNYSLELQRKLNALEEKGSRRGVFSFLPAWQVPALGVAMVLILAFSLVSTKDMWRSEDLPPEEKILLEVAPLVQDFEFFQAMHYLEAMDLDESSLGGSRTRSV